MKKIAFISSLSGIGGTEKSLLSLLKAIPKNRYAVDLLLLGTEGPLLAEVPSWVSVHMIRQSSIKEYLSQSLRTFEFGKVWYGACSYLRIRREIKKYKADTMYQYQMSMFMFDKVEEKYDVAISWFVPNSFQTVFTLENVSATKKLLWVHMDVQKDPMPFDAAITFARYDKIYCVSKACKKGFDTKYPNCSEKTEVFYNLIDTDAIKSAGNSFPSKMDENSDVLRIVTCGRISYEKQPLFAIKISKELLRNGCRNFVWYFVGDGILRNELQKQVNENGLNQHIRILGTLMNPYAYISHADIYVQMSLHESYCLTLAEAQLLGIPAVTTDFPSAYEIVDDGITGLIVSDDWKSIYQGIFQLAANPEQRANMREYLKDDCLQSIGHVDQFLDGIDRMESLK